MPLQVGDHRREPGRIVLGMTEGVVAGPTQQVPNGTGFMVAVHV
jgi:hypothetical protein